MKHPTIDETARAIAALQVSAAEKRAFADEASSAGDREDARVLLCNSENDEAVVREYLSLTPGQTDAVPGNGGELAITSTLFDGTPEYFVDTVRKSPNLLAAAASKERMDLADRAKALNLAVDAAETIQPRNSLEKMLAHQLAAAHAHAMKLLAKSHAWARGNSQAHSVEAARLAGAAARMMDSYQRGLLALDRLRNGGRQVVTVQHVTVADGGRAVVTGRVAAGDGGRARK